MVAAAEYCLEYLGERTLEDIDLEKTIVLDEIDWGNFMSLWELALEIVTVANFIAMNLLGNSAYFADLS